SGGKAADRVRAGAGRSGTPAREEQVAANPLLIGPPAAPVDRLPQSLTAAAPPLTFARPPASGLRPPSLPTVGAPAPGAPAPGTPTPLAPGATAIAGPTIARLMPARGPVDGGAAITVTGTNLGGAETAVVVCGAQVPTGAVEVSGDGTSLTFTAPACRPGSSTVRVVTKAGVATGQFIYVGTAGAVSDSTQRVAAATGAGLIGALLLVAVLMVWEPARRVSATGRPRRPATAHSEPATLGLGSYPDFDRAFRRLLV
ncbi:IPT/TIG domain-containing protein, partial [Cryptosporangium minutisporangium]